MPSQDAAGCRRAAARQPWNLVALADGHGDPLCHRSRTGARLAVQCALDQLLALAAASPERRPEKIVEEFLHPRWRQALLLRWQQSVAAHLQAVPLSAAEVGAASAPPGTVFPDVLYGTTLLAGSAADRLWLFLQIGDGDLVAVGHDGLARRLWPQPLSAGGDETASLCLQQAGQHFRLAAFSAAEGLPELVLLATDGYSKSFASEPDFLKAGSDLLENIRRFGWTATVRQLPAWLRETSEAGSGDDISVGIIARV